MAYTVGQAVRLSGPLKVGGVSMGAGASVSGKIAAVNGDGTYNVQASVAFSGVSYFPSVPESQLSPA